MAAHPGADPCRGPWEPGVVVARLVSPAVLGLETSTVQVEVDLRAGLPAF